MNLTKKKYYQWLALLVCSIFIFFLFQGKNTKNKLLKNGGFKRIYHKNLFVFEDLKQPTNGYLEISGTNKNGVYFCEFATGRLFFLRPSVNSLILKDISNHIINKNSRQHYCNLPLTSYVQNQRIPLLIITTL